MLTVEQVAVFRGETLVLRDVSFTVPAGGALTLTGPNGSGKSTLLRLLAGLVRPVAGRVLWQGRDALEDLAEHGARAAYVGHMDAVKLGLTVRENLRFASAVSRLPIEPAMEAVNLAPLANLPARMLSAGQKRRLALARLVLSKASIWLLDEPTVGLDTASIARFGTLLSAHRARGGIVVAATHIPLPAGETTEFRLG